MNIKTRSPLHPSLPATQPRQPAKAATRAAPEDNGSPNGWMAGADDPTIKNGTMGKLPDDNGSPNGWMGGAEDSRNKNGTMGKLPARSPKAR